MLHRDLKPDNVFLVQQPSGAPAKVKLLDFGLAKLYGGSNNRTDHTSTGVVMGTPMYLSPEQAKGTKAEFGTDVYSLGVIAYEVCAGRVPFVADSAVELMAKHISERPTPLEELARDTPPALAQLVGVMLEKDPQQRPAIAEVRRQLAAMRGQLSGVAVAKPPLASTAVGASSLALAPPERSRRGLVIGSVAVIAIGLALVGYMTLGRDDKPDGGTDHPPVAHASAAAPTPEPTPPPAPAPPAPSPPVAAAPIPAPVPAPAVATPASPVTPTTPAVKPHPTKSEPAKPVAKPAERPAPGKITIQLEGVKRGMIFIDGEQVSEGTDAYQTELPPGAHVVRATSLGHQPAQDTIHVSVHGSNTVRLTLKPRHVDNPVHDPFKDDQ